MITKHRILFISGILIVLNSVLFGLPFPYESFLNIVLGVIIVVLTYLLTRERRTSPHHRDVRTGRDFKKRGQAPEVFVESQPRINRSVSPVAPSPARSRRGLAAKTPSVSEDVAAVAAVTAMTAMGTDTPDASGASSTSGADI